MTNFKQILQLFVPPIYYKVKRKLFPKKELPHHPLPKIEHRKQRMVIIGTGPSLNKTLELYEQQLLETDCMMVNFSANTPLFERIRPAYYTMMDPGWMQQNSAIEDSIRNCIDAIVTRTKWPMYVVLPVRFKNWWAIGEFRKNPNITVLFDESSWRKYDEPELFEELDANRVCPPTNTVLSYCLYLSMYWEYKDTYLVGADTTFTQMVYVGQNDNILYTMDAHYYNNDIVCPDNVEPEKHGRPYGCSMERYLEMCHGIFYEYGMLARFAKWKGLNVYNASEYSMIDCLERKKLK